MSWNTVSYERLLEVTDKDLEVIKHNLGEVYAGAQSVQGYKVISEGDFAEIANAFSVIEDWSNYYHKHKDIQDSKLEELTTENSRLTSENKDLRLKVNELIRQLNNQNVTLGQLQGRLEMMNEVIKAKDNNSNMVSVSLVDMVETLEKAVNLIDENAKALTLSKKLKTEPNVNKHGAEHPKFKDSVKNEDLVADYKELLKYNEEHPEEQKAVLRELAEKYGLSIPGIRNRLIALGEYQARYNTNR